jgi:hypothetical protein
MLFRRNRGMPRKVINSLEKREDIKIIAHEIRGYKPREATFRKVINRF